MDTVTEHIEAAECPVGSSDHVAESRHLYLVVAFLIKLVHVRTLMICSKISDYRR